MSRILIIDDDTETVNLLTGIVKSGGHEAYSVTESRVALENVGNVKPDLILLDIMMAEINGITLCKLIKSDPVLKTIPVVMVSALNDEGTRRDSFNAGADRFITKPIHPKDLMRQIQEVLGG
jgi:CheY-like chemotaxis protein